MFYSDSVNHLNQLQIGDVDLLFKLENMSNCFAENGKVMSKLCGYRNGP